MMIHQRTAFVNQTPAQKPVSIQAKAGHFSKTLQIIASLERDAGVAEGVLGPSAVENKIAQKHERPAALLAGSLVDQNADRTLPQLVDVLRNRVEVSPRRMGRSR